MKRTSLLICLLLSAFLYQSCNSSPKKSRKPVTSIQTKSKKAVIFGNNVEFSSKTDPKGGDLESVAFYLNNEIIKESSEEKNDIKIDGATLLLGKNSVKIVAKKKDGTEGVSNNSITVFSDIEPQTIEYKIVNTFDHNIKHFTQGYEIHNNILFEGTGEYGESALYQKDLKTQKILKELDLSDQYFGEGITIFGDNLYQLTYKKQKGFIYDKNTFEKKREFSYPYREGWGLTHNETHLLMSDGTENIYFLNPETLKEESRIQVYTNRQKIEYINELEYVDGFIYANVWTTNTIIKIEAKTGKVVGYMEMDEMIQNAQMLNPGSDVLNGIAYNPKSNTFLITGKLWPKVFEIELQ